MMMVHQHRTAQAQQILRHAQSCAHMHLIQ